MLAGLDVNTLVCKHEVAKVQCEEKLVGKDAVMFVGCCGSGKSTVSAFVTNRSTFKFLNGNLQAQGSVGDFVIGGGAKDVTDGLAIEQIPGKTSLFLVDSAGTGAAYNRETGIVQEISGSLSRQAVFQSARTVRLVLFLSAARCDISNDRGKHCIMDFNLLAEMLSDSADQLDSVGFIVTSPAATLGEHARNRRLTYNVIETIQITLKGLMEEGACPDEVATTKGRMLMESCLRCFDAAIEIIQSDDADFELDDGELLPELVKRKCRIFPVNVLATQQDQLQTWLRGLPPIPASSLKCALPSNCKDRLQNLLQEKVFAITDKVKGELSPSAEDEGTTQLMHELSTIVKLLLVLDDSLLPGARQQYMTKLSDVVHKQNSYYAESALDGVATGCAIKLKTAMQGLQLMEAMFAQCQSLKNSGQHAAGFEEVRSKCVTRAEEKFKELFPGAKGISGVSWNDVFIEEFRKLLEIAPELGQQGINLLKKWSHTFKGEVSSLTADVNSTECATQQSIQSAMKLDELERNLARHRVTEIFQQYGCPLPDFSVLLADAKKSINDRMVSLSAEVFASGQPDMNGDFGKKLRDLCWSPHIGELLGRADLEEVYIKAPLTATLSQEQINACAQKMRDPHAPLETWTQELAVILQGVKRWESESETLQRPAKLTLNLQDLLDQLEQNVRAIEESFAELVRRDSVPDSDCLEKLEELIPFDWLLQHSERTVYTAQRAIENISSKLARMLQKLLGQATKVSKQVWGERDMVTEQFDVLKRLQRLYGLTAALSEHASEQVKSLSEEAKNFVLDHVQVELKLWSESSAKIGKSVGWEKDFLAYVESAEKMQKGFEPGIDLVTAAREGMRCKIQVWHEEQVRVTEEAMGSDQFGEKVRPGLVLEDHELAKRLRLVTPSSSATCRKLLEQQVEAWLHEAEEHQYAPAACAHFHTNMKEVLRLLKSLRRTEQLKKTEQLNAWVDELEKACAKLDKQTDRDKLKLQKLLRDGSYGEAARMLNKGLCGAVRDEFNECVEEAVRNSFGVLKLDLEEVAALQFQHVEDAVQQAQSLQDLCANDGLPDELRRKLVVLKDRVGVLRREAMERLDHEFSLMREHRWGKRKKELKDSFVKVVGVLTGEKSVLRKCLSKLHDSASKELPTLSLADLADWAQYFDEAVHDMTQEQPDAAVKLVGQFTTCFSEKFEAAKEAFRRAKEAHDWFSARDRWEGLNGAVQTIEKLPIWQQMEKKQRDRFRQQLKKLEVTRVSPPARSKMKDGDFLWALQDLCSIKSEHEDELIQTITDTVDRSIAASKRKGGANSDDMRVLHGFLEALGEHCPTELASLHTDARRACNPPSPAGASKAGMCGALREALSDGDDQKLEALMMKTGDEIARASLSQSDHAGFVEVQGVWRLLKNIYLEEYAQPLLQSGRHNVQALKEMDDDAFGQCGMKKGHMRRLQRHLAKLGAEGSKDRVEPASGKATLLPEIANPSVAESPKAIAQRPASSSSLPGEGINAQRIRKATPSSTATPTTWPKIERRKNSRTSMLSYVDARRTRT